MNLEEELRTIESKIHDTPKEPFIEFIAPQDAEDPTLKRMYKRVSTARKSVANIHQSQSLMPAVIKNHLDLYMSIMYNNETSLDRRQRELIATVVSFSNGCKYCITHHYEALLEHWKGAPLPNDIVFKKNQLNQLDQCLVDFAIKLTLKPYEIKKEDVDKLKKNGLDDKSILNVVLVISYFNFVNRLALGTGCPLEPKEERDYNY